MSFRKMILVASLVLFIVTLAGCANSGEAHKAVESYLQALVAKDDARFSQLICPAFEAEALTEFDSFGAVDAGLDNVACRTNGTDGNATLVTCSGSIVVTYRGENNQVLDLSANTYRVTRVDGEWKLCGYN